MRQSPILLKFAESKLLRQLSSQRGQMTKQQQKGSWLSSWFVACVAFELDNMTQRLHADARPRARELFPSVNFSVRWTRRSGFLLDWGVWHTSRSFWAGLFSIRPEPAMIYIPVGRPMPAKSMWARHGRSRLVFLHVLARTCSGKIPPQ